MAEGHQLKMTRCENCTFVHSLSTCVGRCEGLGGRGKWGRPRHGLVEGEECEALDPLSRGVGSEFPRARSV